VLELAVGGNFAVQRDQFLGTAIDFAQPVS